MKADPLRVGIGATLLHDPATRGALDGIGVYTRELATRLAANSGVELVPVVMNAAAARAAPSGTLRFPVQRNAMAAWSLATGASFPGAAALARRIDVYFATDYRVPKLRRTPVCATLFDAIPLSHPEWANPRLRAVKNHVLRATARWADRVIAISQAMVPELTTQFGIAADRITVTPLGVDNAWFETETPQRIAALRERLGLGPRYLLFVGTLQPRKNVGRLLDAFERLPSALRSGSRLVIAGRAGWSSDDVVSRLRAAESAGQVRWLDFVPDADLRALYQGAAGFVFPSLYEGFGLPVLEAFASQVPVLASNVTSLPEVAGNAALLVDPLDVDAIAAGMTALLDDVALADRLRQRGTLRAREFTWERCARETLGVLRAMA